MYSLNKEQVSKAKDFYERMRNKNEIFTKRSESLFNTCLEIILYLRSHQLNHEILTDFCAVVSSPNKLEELCETKVLPNKERSNLLKYLSLLPKNKEEKEREHGFVFCQLSSAINDQD